MKLNEKYNKNTFIDFIDAFLPEDFQSKEEDIIIKKDRYKEITKAKILGFSESLDLYVLEMDHAHDKDPRVTIATDAFKILADHWIHRALVIFKNNDSENYRFSYLTITLDLNEKNKVTKSYSNARRYSFYLGTNVKVKTPEQQLIKKGRIKDIDDLLNRFSVEVVNKEFYLEVAKFFDELISTEEHNLILPGVSETDVNVRKSFAVRLIGRIMFCWFLKQKRSESGQLIPDEILSSNAVNENYYHNTLEPLFFAVLNTSIDARDIRNDLFDKVPYLNGGLFNPQTDDFYELDRGTFSSKHINTLKISDKWFKEFFELLQTYNFTIDENMIFDQELSVDPEMLGRIFENLLAEINPETGSSERKRTGSFYTPRQIVEYMVDQSLIEYLKVKTSINDKKLMALVSYDLIDDTEHPLDDQEKIQIIDAIESLKILDPACGSGAYPIGALQKIVYILQQVDPDCSLWLEKKLKGIPDLYKQKIISESKNYDYTRKKDVIKNSIFGVDIQPVAVDVSRLRCFLTLVVESEIDDTKQNRGIESLPNLDFKFVCANTLVALPRTNETNLFDDHSGIVELSKIMSEYFSCNSQRKNELKIKFTNTQKEILEKTVSAFGRNTGDLTLKLTTWNPFSNSSNSWFDPEWMFGLEEKFDVVIGNPPYLRIQGIRDANSEFANFLTKTYKAATGSFDLYVIFVEKSLELINHSGIVNFIMPTKWTNAAFGKGLRHVVSEKGAANKIINFGAYQVFNASTYTGLQWFKPNSAGLLYLELDRDLKSNSELSEYLQKLKPIDGMVIAKEKLTKEIWTLASNDISKIIDKLNSQPRRISDIFEKIFQGLATSKDDVYFLYDCSIEKGVVTGISKQLNKTVEIERDFVKPLLKGEDVHRYENIKTNRFVVFPYKLANGDAKLYEENEIKTQFPMAYSYLKECEDVLRDREKGRFNIDGEWFQFGRKQGINFAEKEKLVAPEISLGGNFAYDKNGDFYSTTTIYGYIKKKNVIDSYKTLAAILNSQLLWWYLVNTGTVLANGYFRFKPNYIKPFPVPEIPPETALVLEKLVDGIMTSKSDNSKEDVSELEEKINSIVYTLYNLTPTEIELVKKA